MGPGAHLCTCPVGSVGSEGLCLCTTLHENTALSVLCCVVLSALSSISPSNCSIMGMLPDLFVITFDLPLESLDPGLRSPPLGTAGRFSRFSERQAEKTQDATAAGALLLVMLCLMGNSGAGSVCLGPGSELPPPCSNSHPVF